MDLKELHALVSDFALYTIFLDRCEQYCDDPPTPWDPVFSHSLK